MLTTGLNTIDSLLGDYSWVVIPKTPISLSYSFMIYPPSNLSSEDLYGLSEMTTAQKRATATALASWTTVANITFRQVAESLSGTRGNIIFADNDQGVISAAYTLSYNNSTTLTNAYIFLNTASYNNYDFKAGSYGLSTLVHEIGHALGLKHPGNYNASGGGGAPPYLPSSTDNLDYTVMSYNDGTAQTSSYSYPGGLMLYDIQAIQYLYGANMTYHAGDDTYFFNNTTVPVCVWDAGGINTFDFSRCTNRVVINLNAGTFSQTSLGINNVSIAYNVNIQKAIAGSGGSTIYCNDLSDIITGGAGNDLVVIGRGSSAIDGGSGIDTLQVTALAHNISLDSIVQIETLDMNSQAVTMKTSQLELFQSILNGVGGIIFSDSGRAVAKPSVGSYTLSGNGPNSLTIPELSGHVSVTGAASIDTVTLSGTASDYMLVQTADGYQVSTLNGLNNLRVVEVDRLQAADIKLAIDLGISGHAAGTVEILGAAFGKDTITPEYVGIGLNLFDSGMSMLDVCQVAIDTALFQTLVGSADNTAFVNLVYKNVVGVLPGSADLNYFVSMLNNSGGTMSQADLLVYAATSEANLMQVNLMGLQATGVIYQ